MYRHLLASFSRWLWVTLGVTLWLSQAAIGAELSLTGGKKFCESVPKANCTPSPAGKDSAVESGEVGGVPYYIYQDGSGAVRAVPSADIANYDPRTMWSLACRRDAMTGERSCSARFGQLWLFVSNQRGDVVSVGADTFPGSVTSIRVGNRRFDTSHRDGNFSQSAQILPLLKDGAAVATRYVEWPHREWIDAELEIHGAQAALQLLRWVVRNSK